MTPLTLISQFYWMARKTYFSALSCTLPPFPLFVCLVYHCPSPFIPLFLSWLLDFFPPSPIAANPSLNPSPPTPHCLFPSFTIFPWSFHFDPFTSVFVFAPTHDFLSSYNFTLSSHTPATSLWFFFFFTLLVSNQFSCFFFPLHRDVRRLVVAMSRARLGLYIFARVSLFQNCFELTPAFNQLTARPLQLHIRPHEYYSQEQPVRTVCTHQFLKAQYKNITYNCCTLRHPSMSLLPLPPDSP